MSQAVGLLTGSTLTGSAVDRVGSKSGSAVNRVGSKSWSGVDRVGSKSGPGQKSGPGSDQFRDDVSIRFDRVENGSGQR